MDIEFGQEVLKYSFRTDHAVKTGEVRSEVKSFMSASKTFEFTTSYNPEIYNVESPDAIEPVGSSAVTLLRYTENNTSAAIAHNGTTDIIVFGFPFETITTEKSRARVMQAVLDYFDKPE